ncbi:unnamed protein product [Paramecium sonneborni]|uniref:Uncharacterized protein n=1 Tax=Paramecium sonneborni TaxID=65129 RepID=A0A8S1LLX7_9CILI|nr:unnamed protein product [Paramecium sonneborni]
MKITIISSDNKNHEYQEKGNLNNLIEEFEREKEAKFQDFQFYYENQEIKNAIKTLKLQQICNGKGGTIKITKKAVEQKQQELEATNQSIWETKIVSNEKIQDQQQSAPFFPRNTEFKKPENISTVFKPIQNNTQVINNGVNPVPNNRVTNFGPQLTRFTCLPAQTSIPNSNSVINANTNPVINAPPLLPISNPNPVTNANPNQFINSTPPILTPNQNQNPKATLPFLIPNPNRVTIANTNPNPNPTPPFLNQNPTPVIIPNPTPVINPTTNPTPVLIPNPTTVINPTPVIIPNPTPVIIQTPNPVINPTPNSTSVINPTPNPTPVLIQNPTPPVINSTPNPPSVIIPHLRKELVLKSVIEEEIKIINDFKIKITDKGNRVEVENEKKDFMMVFLEQYANENIQTEIRQQLSQNRKDYLSDPKYVVKCQVSEKNDSTKVLFKQKFDGFAIQWATGLVTICDFELKM